jgi:hypothetical protein
MRSDRTTMIPILIPRNGNVDDLLLMNSGIWWEKGGGRLVTPSPLINQHRLPRGKIRWMIVSTNFSQLY